MSRLSSFLPALKAADKVLQNDQILGKIGAWSMELDSSEDEEADEFEEEEEATSLQDSDADRESSVDSEMSESNDGLSGNSSAVSSSVADEDDSGSTAKAISTPDRTSLENTAIVHLIQTSSAPENPTSKSIRKRRRKQHKPYIEMVIPLIPI